MSIARSPRINRPELFRSRDRPRPSISLQTVDKCERTASTGAMLKSFPARKAQRPAVWIICVAIAVGILLVFTRRRSGCGRGVWAETGVDPGSVVELDVLLVHMSLDFQSAACRGGRSNESH